MAAIKPFSALHYAGSNAPMEALVCPPYDIISEEERQAYLKENPDNIIRAELPRDGEDPYAAAAEFYRDLQQRGVLAVDLAPAFYLYEQEYTWEKTGEKKVLRGFFSLVRLEDYETGVILPHEETLSKAKEDRFRLLSATRCNSSPIFSLFEDSSREIAAMMDHVCASCPPRYNFTQGEFTFRLRVIEDTCFQEKLRQLMAPKKLYIADGHHRYETSLRYRNQALEKNPADEGARYTMMLLSRMDDPGLTVLPTHRVLRDLPEFDGARLLEDCAPYFTVEEASSIQALEALLERKKAEGGHSIGYTDGGALLCLSLKDPSVMERVLPDKSQDYRLLDVSILHQLILERLLKIDRENMANQKNLYYTRSAQEAVEAVKSGSSPACFLLPAPYASEVHLVASHNEKMPQKSTYFFPKPITGLAMNLLDSQ